MLDAFTEKRWIECAIDEWSDKTASRLNKRVEQREAPVFVREVKHFPMEPPSKVTPIDTDVYAKMPPIAKSGHVGEGDPTRARGPRGGSLGGYLGGGRVVGVL